MSEDYRQPSVLDEVPNVTVPSVPLDYDGPGVWRCACGSCIAIIGPAIKAGVSIRCSQCGDEYKPL